jgi:hypothetical protein
MSVQQENRYRALVRRQTDAKTAQMIPFAPPERGPRHQAEPPKQNLRRGQVRAWMRRNANGYETATNLAEAANASIDLPAGAMDDPEHWVWEEAIAAIVRQEGGAA